MDFFYGFRLVLIQFIYFVVVLLALVLLSSIFIAHILQIISRIDEPIAMSKKIKSCKKTNHQLTNYNFYDAKKKKSQTKEVANCFFLRIENIGRMPFVIGKFEQSLQKKKLIYCFRWAICFKRNGLLMDEAECLGFRFLFAFNGEKMKTKQGIKWK